LETQIPLILDLGNDFAKVSYFVWHLLLPGLLRLTRLFVISAFVIFSFDIRFLLRIFVLRAPVSLTYSLLHFGRRLLFPLTSSTFHPQSSCQRYFSPFSRLCPNPILFFFGLLPFFHFFFLLPLQSPLSFQENRCVFPGLVM